MQPPSAGSPPDQKSRKNIFQAMSDAAIDKLFNQNLGLSEKDSQLLKKDSSAASASPAPSASPSPAPSSPASPPSGQAFNDAANGPKSGHGQFSAPAVPPAGAGGAGGWVGMFNASPPAPPSDALSPAKAGPNSEQEMKALQESFGNFERELKLVLESLNRGEVPQFAQLELTRGALLATLSQSALADKLPQLQKYLRADILHLLAALSQASSVSQKLKALAFDHEEKFDDISQEVSHQMKEENKPFWGLMV
jgi:hypothetical protein